MRHWYDADMVFLQEMSMEIYSSDMEVTGAEQWKLLKLMCFFAHL